MEITVNNEKYNTIEQITTNTSTIREFLEELKINPETVLVIKNKEVITESSKIENKDHLTLLSVISGG